MSQIASCDELTYFGATNYVNNILVFLMLAWSWISLRINYSPGDCNEGPETDRYLLHATGVSQRTHTWRRGDALQYWCRWDWNLHLPMSAVVRNLPRRLKRRNIQTTQSEFPPCNQVTDALMLWIPPRLPTIINDWQRPNPDSISFCHSIPSSFTYPELHPLTTTLVTTTLVATCTLKHLLLWTKHIQMVGDDNLL